MEKCSSCNWSYPEEFLNAMFSSKGVEQSICGICALAISNKTLGVERTHFTGEMAEDLRLDAVEWRKTHTKDGKKI